MNIQFKILAVALLCSLLATSAFADDLMDEEDGGGPYVALNVGRGAMYPGCNAGFTTCEDKNHDVYFATYGYQYTPTWGLEGTFGQIGWITGYPNIKAIGLSAEAVGTLHLGDTLGVFAKAGFTYGDFRVNGPVPPAYIFNPSGTSPSGAIGLLFNVSPHMTLRVQGDYWGSYTVLTNAKKMNIITTTFGLMWRY